jgi:UDP-N-acetylenolpyruvoylglucosamine reductase
MMVEEKTSHAVPGSARPLADELVGLLTSGTVVRGNEPMARHTTLRVGGPADAWVEPGSESDLAKLLAFCRERDIQFLAVGRGSNLLVRDGGFRGVILCLSNPCFATVEAANSRLRCGAGARLKAVAGEAKRHGIEGLEFLEGIPGTVGGALRMNAGAMGGAIFDTVETVRVMEYDGTILELHAAELAAQYRECKALGSRIALSAVLRGRPGDPATIERRMGELAMRRRASQPAAPSAGCMFRNPQTIPAGKLIDELGLKGARVGGAVVSLEHGNFIVTEPPARARDVLELIKLIRRRAHADRGVELETEVQIVGVD